MKCFLILITYILLSSITWSQEIIELSDYNGHPKLKAVEVEIEGKKFNFLFDTGAGVTILTPSTLKDLGKESYGRAVGYRMLGEKVEYSKCDNVEINLGSYKLSHPTVGVWDLNKTLPDGWPQIDGVISLSSFQKGCITIDLSKNQIVIETNETCRSKFISGYELEVIFANGFTGQENSIFIAERRKKRTYWFLMDSGNLDYIKLSYTTAKEWDVLNDDLKGRQEIGKLYFQSMNHLHEVKVVADDIIYDGVFNFDFLAEFDFTVDFNSKKVSINNK